MKKILMVSVVTIMTALSAHAAIVSKAYVDERVNIISAGYAVDSTSKQNKLDASANVRLTNDSTNSGVIKGISASNGIVSIQKNLVASGDIASGAVTDAKINNGTISTTNIDDGAIDNSKINNSADINLTKVAFPNSTGSNGIMVLTRSGSAGSYTYRWETIDRESNCPAGTQPSSLCDAPVSSGYQNVCLSGNYAGCLCTNGTMANSNRTACINPCAGVGNAEMDLDCPVMAQADFGNGTFESSCVQSYCRCTDGYIASAYGECTQFDDEEPENPEEE